MPVELALSPDEDAISLDEYVDALDRSGFDLTQRDQLVATAPLLRKLANNRDFMLDHVFEELRSEFRFQEANMYAPEVVVLHTSGSYFLRANIWKTPGAAELRIPGYQYDICHDHNFDILTVGYLGPGYSCRSYTYDRSQYEGRLGEVVDLQPQGEFTLTRGKVALYRAKTDVHIQLPPRRVSVSLNLIPKAPVQNDLQFQFDEATGRIVRYLNFTGVEAAVRLADVLGGAHSELQLAQLASHHPNLRVRALAEAALQRAGCVPVGHNMPESCYVRYLVDLEVAQAGASMRPYESV